MGGEPDEGVGTGRRSYSCRIPPARRRKDETREQAGPVLGIESSCDETAVAVLAGDGAVLADIVLSQIGRARALWRRGAGDRRPRSSRAPPRHGAGGHGSRGGEVHRSRRGGSNRRAGTDRRPHRRERNGEGHRARGGVSYIAVNHLEAHALTARLPGLLPGGAPFPYLLLLVSGGHCQCVAVEGVGRYRRLGGTVDDAVGEAFDKVAKLLGLGWPGGPALERLAARATRDASRFPGPCSGGRDAISAFRA